jgi:murein DD-endopeptidase MepM/ murein hydrolase activator NlpD
MRDPLERRERPRRLRRFSIWLLVAAMASGVGIFLWGGTEGPGARWVEAPALVGPAGTAEAHFTAGRSGLREVRVLARLPNGSTVPLAQKDFPSEGILGSGVHDYAVRIELDPLAQGLPEGRLRLEAWASDHAMASWLDDAVLLAESPLEIDLTPPTIRILSGRQNVRQGGSGVLAWETEGGVDTSGVRIGDLQFQGFAVDQGPPVRWVALYMLPHDADVAERPRVTAVDPAGNRRTVPAAAQFRSRDFPSEEIPVSDALILGTVRPLLEAQNLPIPEDPVDAFLAVNRDLREQSDEQLRRAVAASAPALLLSGAFRQQPGTKVGSRYAEHRRYRYAGELVDRQDHLGYDLASVRRAPISAAQRGTVVLAGDLGIYGRSVVIDHGLGVSSLYAHLSDVDVTEGDAVEQGQRIGRSGETGLAAGDHLHFSILVGGRHVDPIEWWDPNWVKRQILIPLEDNGVEVPLGPDTQGR